MLDVRIVHSTVYVEGVFPASVLVCASLSPLPLLHVGRSVVIHNRSDVVVHYEWKAFSSDLEEQAEKDM